MTAHNWIAEHREPQWDLVVLIVFFLAFLAFGIWSTTRRENP